MKTRLTRISPGNLGLFLGAIGFIVSIPKVALAFATIGPGKTVRLNSYVSMAFTNSLDPVWLVLAYPFLNAIAAVISGFLLAWLYNIIALRYGGISFTLDQQ